MKYPDIHPDDVEKFVKLSLGLSTEFSMVR
jgi:hypothetical protein